MCRVQLDEDGTRRLARAKSAIDAAGSFRRSGKRKSGRRQGGGGQGGGGGGQQGGGSQRRKHKGKSKRHGKSGSHRSRRRSKTKEEHEAVVAALEEVKLEVAALRRGQAEHADAVESVAQRLLELEQRPVGGGCVIS